MRNAGLLGLVLAHCRVEPDSETLGLAAELYSDNCTSQTHTHARTHARTHAHTHTHTHTHTQNCVCIPSHLSSVPLRSRPTPIASERSGVAHKLPSRSGQSTAAKRIWCIFCINLHPSDRLMTNNFLCLLFVH